MVWQKLTDPAVRAFIRDHENADPAALALKKPPQDDWPYPLILDQIQARSKAARKMPTWHAASHVIFPPPSLIEQASSEATAQYKASFVSGAVFADLTTGAGIDFRAFSGRFQKGIAVEQDAAAAELLAHNLKALGIKADIRQGRAEDVMNTLPPCDLIYIDPQRRAANAKGRYRFEDCAPDILSMLPLLRTKTATIMIKASPMLDVAAGIQALGDIAAVHIVEWQGDCREVLYVIKPGEGLDLSDVPVTAISIDNLGAAINSFTFTRRQEESSAMDFAMPGTYLFEPGPAFQKAGCFRSLAAYYGMAKLHPHTHLYTSNRMRLSFPGRLFEVQGIYSADGRGLPLSQANLTLRNFPGSAEALRKKLKIADGGPNTLFACTLMNGRKALVHARKFACTTP